jgi:proprotein convertase subtilisin/kexin type 2
MYRFKNKIWLTAALLLTLTACGGGGGGDASVVTPVAKTCAAVTSPGDPLYSDQWHLKNTGSPTGTAGEDTNVESVWNNGICGIGITIAVVDDGLEIGHEDLAANVVAGGSHNYVDETNDPTPPAGSTDAAHGTSVAGVAAAVGFNNIGVRGVAHGAELVGYNLTEALNSINEADAAVRGKATVDISNNSWSHQEDDGALVATTATWSAAIDDGITNGRGGKGINYFWAGGNGKLDSDNSNYDGMANYQGVNAVGALDDTGKSTSYSEEGANILISAHAGEFCDTNTTTTVDLTGAAGANNAGIFDGLPDDYANDNYTQCFNGTSSATPLVAGVAALVLQANPNLTRRDLRLLLAKTARKNDGTDSDWKINGAGLNINHKYGYGAVDATAAVTAAPGWTLLAAEKTPESYPGVITTAAIPDNGPAVTNTLKVVSSGITQLEFVDITFASDHTYWGDLILELTSPSGTKSILTNYNGKATGNGAAFTAGFRFGSVRHFDETPVGNWVLSVRDDANIDTGNITSWSIKLYGR